MRFPASCGVLLLGWVAGTSSLLAQATFTWSGASGTFFDPTNWSEGVAPDSEGTSFVAFPEAAGAYIDAYQPINVAGVTLSLGENNSFWLSNSSTLTVGAGGIDVSGSSGYAFIDAPTVLAAAQGWEVADGTSLYLWQPLEGAYDLVKTGGGLLALGAASSGFSGNLTLAAGSLIVYENQAAGTGVLTLMDGSTLYAYTRQITLDNAISLGTGVTFGGPFDDRLILAGTLTPAQTSTVINLVHDTRLTFAGAVVDSAGGATQVTIAGDGVAEFTGTNTYSGGTVAQGAGVIFADADALPATGPIQALNGGYVGAGYSGGAEEVVSRVASPAEYEGSVGLDSLGEVNTFTDDLDFGGFTHELFKGLGSLTEAIFDGTLTPAGGGDYRFGGGDGRLFIRSTLALSGAAGVVVQGEYDQILTVVLQGENGYAGDLFVQHGVAVLDAAGALPEGGAFSTGHDGYVGYTQAFSAASFADFAALATSTQPTSVLGLDSSDEYGPRVYSGAIDLSGFDDIFLGSATQVALTGAVTAPTSGTLALTGIKGGLLNLQSDLLAAHGVDRVIIGSGNPHLAKGGAVRLAGNNDYAGGTTLQSGGLIVAHDQALGSGTLWVPFGSQQTLAADPAAGLVTLANAISLDGDVLHLGFSHAEDDQNDWGFAVLEHAGLDHQPHQLALTGTISGIGGLEITGHSLVTLAGDNTFSGGVRTHGPVYLIAAADTALGTGVVDLGDGVDLEFTSLAPQIGGLRGGLTVYGDITNDSYVVLPDGATLTIDNGGSGYFYGHIGGLPHNLTSTGVPPAVNAAVVKAGAGELILAGASSYSGGTTVTEGTLVLQHTNAAGSGTITVDGGTLAVNGTSIYNPLQLLQGRLTGDGWVEQATIADGFVLAPGYAADGSAPVGSLHFGDLTLGGGGILEWNLIDPLAGAGYGWDHVSVFYPTTLTIAADHQNQFVVKVSSEGWAGEVGEVGPGKWEVFTAQSISLSGPDALLDRFSFDSTDFNIGLEGSFWMSQEGNSLFINFTPVPEPSTYALLALGLGAVGIGAWRRRR